MTPVESPAKELTDLENAVDVVDRLSWDDTDREDLIGLEIEAFPMAASPGYGSRLHLAEVTEIVAEGLSSPNVSTPPNPPVFATEEIR